MVYYRSYQRVGMLSCSATVHNCATTGGLMIKRILLLGVVIFLAIIVVASLGSIVWAATSSTEHLVVTANATIALAFTTFFLGTATLVLAVVAFNELREGQKRAQETQRALWRPLVVPTGNAEIFQDT